MSGTEFADLDGDGVEDSVLEDDNGNTYPELSSGEGVPQYIGYLRSVKPAQSAQGNAIFDAPPRHYKMKIADETGVWCNCDLSRIVIDRERAVCRGAHNGGIVIHTHARQIGRR